MKPHTVYKRVSYSRKPYTACSPAGHRAAGPIPLRGGGRVKIIGCKKPRARVRGAGPCLFETLNILNLRSAVYRDVDAAGVGVAPAAGRAGGAAETGARLAHFLERGGQSFLGALHGIVDVLVGGAL